jgi:hypothetical protein
LPEHVECTTTVNNSEEWSIDTSATKSSLCDPQRMLAEEDKPLEDFNLLVTDLCKDNIFKIVS